MISLTLFILAFALLVTGQSLLPPVKFGASADFSGSARAISLSYHAGIRIAFDEINAAGGYNGRQLQFITMDDQYMVANTLSNLQAIKAAHPDVVAFMASTGTSNVRASIEWAANNSIGLFFPATGAESLRNPFVRVVPNMVASYFAEASFAVRLAAQVLKLNRVAIVYQNDAFGEPPATQARNKLRDMGMQPHVMANYPTGSMNMTGVVNALFSKRTLPQAVILFTFGPQTSLVIRDYQARTQYPTKFILISVADMVNLRSIMGSSGVYENVYLIRTAPDPNDSSLQISQRFNAAANLYNNSVYREHYTMLGYMAGHMMMQTLTRHDSRTNVTSASFLDVVYNTGVFNIMGLTVGPFSDSSQAPCNQGLRQLWLAQATNSGWRTVSNDAGLTSLLEPWPNMCIFQDKKSRLPSIWGIGIAPQESSQLAKDFVAGVKASVRYFNEIEGGGLSNIVLAAEDLDWNGNKMSGINPFFTSTNSTPSLSTTPANAIQRFVAEHNAAGIIGSSHLSIAGSSATGELSDMLKDLNGRPIMGLLGGDALFHDSPATTQIVPHRAAYVTDFYGLLDALYIQRSLKRIGLACVTGDGPQFVRICSQARRAFDTMQMVPAFATEWLLTPSAPLLEETIANLPLQDDISLTGAVDAIIFVGPNLQSFSQLIINLVALKRNITVGVGSYIDTANAFIPTDSPPILQVRTTPPRSIDKYSSLYEHTDALGTALSIAPATRETSGFLQGVLATRTLIRGISSLADPENGASFIRASLLNREYLLFDSTEHPIRVGPYLDPLSAQCSQPGNASSCVQPFCRQGLTSVFIHPLGSPAEAEEYPYPSCGTPPSSSLRVRMPMCKVRHLYGKSVWTDIQRALRFNQPGTIFYTVVIAGLFVLLFGSALLGVSLFKFRERKLKREKTHGAAKQTTSALIMGVPSSSRPVMSPARSTSRGRGSASASSPHQHKSGALPTVFAGVAAASLGSPSSSSDGNGHVVKREPIVMIRPSTANYIALFGVVADFATFTYLFLPARIPWVGAFVYNVMGIPQLDTVSGNNWFGLFFAYMYLILVLCLASKTVLAKLQVHAPLVFVLAGYILPAYSWILIPIVKDLLEPFAIICTQNQCFLDDDCTGLVWTTGHWTTAILSAIGLWSFVPVYAFFSQAWWKIQHHLDIIEANWMTLTITWLKVTLVALNTVLPHNIWEVQIIQVLAMLGLLVLVNSHHKSTDIKWWPIVQSVGIGCALISAVFGLVGESLGTTDPTGYLSALVSMWILVFVGGFVAIRRQYRTVIIPRAREHRRLQSRFAQVMAFDASSSSYASSDDSSGGDSSSIHSIAGLTKSSVQTVVNWLMALEKNKVVTGSEASWMMSNADKHRNGFVHTVYTAAGGDTGGTVEKFQKVLMEHPAIDSVRAAVKSAEAESLATVRFDTVVSVRAESHGAVGGGVSSASQLLPNDGR